MTHIWWHDCGRAKSVLHHQANSKAWKSLDEVCHPFKSRIRIVRSGLMSDVLTHFTIQMIILGDLLSPKVCLHECEWSNKILWRPRSKVVRKLYWCVFATFLMNWRIYGSNGLETYDDSQNKLCMHVGLMQTINDFPVYAILLSWSIEGMHACSCCLEDTWY